MIFPWPTFPPAIFGFACAENAAEDSRILGLVDGGGSSSEKDSQAISSFVTARATVSAVITGPDYAGYKRPGKGIPRYPSSSFSIFFFKTLRLPRLRLPVTLGGGSSGTSISEAADWSLDGESSSSDDFAVIVSFIGSSANFSMTRIRMQVLVVTFVVHHLTNYVLTL